LFPKVSRKLFSLSLTALVGTIPKDTIAALFDLADTTRQKKLIWDCSKS